MEPGLKTALERIETEAQEKTGRLDLNGLGLTEIPPPVFDLSHLTELDLGYRYRVGKNTISEIPSAISKLTQLSKLDLSANAIKTLDSLRGLSALQTLHCVVTEISDLSPVSGLSALHTLNCNHTQVSDLSPVSGLSSLQTLNCGSTGVSDLSPVSGLRSLHTLDCSHTGVRDLSPVSGLRSLQFLNCSGTGVSDLSPVSGLSALQTLSCHNTQVRDLSPVSGLPSLQSLDCSGSAVSDLSPVSGLSALHTLGCGDTGVSDLSPVSGLPSLQTLRCDKTQVRDLSPVSGLRSLQILWCSDIQVRDVSPLRPLLAQKLRSLYLTNCPVEDVPPEILTGDCAAALRAHFADLGEAPQKINQFKILILGNGRVGKTQIARALQGLDMIDGDVSTHAIQRISHQIFEDKKLPLARIWDFGGQDIYHGTHALFMRGRAAIILAWNQESETTPFHEHQDQRFKNEKLPYWIEFIRRLSGQDNPVILTQTRCDDHGCLDPDIDPSLLAEFKFHAALNFDAKTKQGMEDLLDYLRIAQRKIPRPLIGPGRLAVKEAVQAMQAETPEVKLWPFSEFEALCEETGGVSDPRLFADYLHHADVFFYRQGLFEDKIVLDTDWMFDAIYAVLTRDACKLEIERSHGRFTLGDLGRWLWDAEYTYAEQAQFLDMMLGTGICFRISPGYHWRSDTEDAKREDEKRKVQYIAPELLPDQTPDLTGRWDDEGESVSFDVEFDFLPDPVFRAVMSRLGHKAGLNGIYWKTGLCLFEKNYKSAARISLSKAEDGFAGTLHVQTQNNQAQAFCDDLIDLIYRVAQEYGFTPKTPKPDRGKSRGESKPVEALEAPIEQKPETELAFAQPIPTNFSKEVFVSYSWANEDYPDHEIKVDQLCAEAEARGIKIWRDKDDLGVGKSIDVFMNDLSQSRRCFIFLSEKYLKSEFCMYELYHLWLWSRSNSALFHERVRIFNIDAKIFSIPDRLKIARYWKGQYDEYAQLGIEDFGIMAPETFDLISHVKAFAMQTDKILTHIARTVQLSDFDDFLENGFTDL